MVIMPMSSHPGATVSTPTSILEEVTVRCGTCRLDMVGRIMDMDLATEWGMDIMIRGIHHTMGMAVIIRMEAIILIGTVMVTDIIITIIPEAMWPVLLHHHRIIMVRAQAIPTPLLAMSTVRPLIAVDRTVILLRRQ